MTDNDDKKQPLPCVACGGSGRNPDEPDEICLACGGKGIGGTVSDVVPGRQ